MSDLDARLLAAHEDGDTLRLIALYQEAAAAASGDDARAFYLTQAHVFALEAGHVDAHHICAALIAMGRDLPL